MKALFPVLCTSILIVCFSAEGAEVPRDKLVVRNNTFYYINSDDPFDGEYVDYHSNGQLKERGSLKNGQRDGLHESFYNNGQISFRGSFQDGKREGLTESFHASGKLKHRGVWKDGKGNGLFETYDKRGQPTDIVMWKDGKMEGLRAWTPGPSDSVLFPGPRRTNYEDGKKHGREEHFFGGVVRISCYANGKLTINKDC